MSARFVRCVSQICPVCPNVVLVLYLSLLLACLECLQFLSVTYIHFFYNLCSAALLFETSPVLALFVFSEAHRLCPKNVLKLSSLSRLDPILTAVFSQMSADLLRNVSYTCVCREYELSLASKSGSVWSVLNEATLSLHCWYSIHAK